MATSCRKQQVERFLSFWQQLGLSRQKLDTFNFEQQPVYTAVIFLSNISSVSANGVELSLSPPVGLSVGLTVLKVYCGKMADWIRMSFGMVSGVSRGINVLDGGGDRPAVQ